MRGISCSNSARDIRRVDWGSNALDLRTQLGDQAGNRSRIDSSRKKHAHGHVGYQVGPHGIGHRLPHAVVLFFDGARAAFLPPIGANVVPEHWRLRHAGAHPHPGASGQSEDSAIKRPWLGHRAPKIESRHSGRLVFRCHQPGSQQRLHLRGKSQAVCGLRIVERLDSVGVTGQKKLTRAGIPYGQGEHAAQLGQHAFPVPGKQLQQNFRVGSGAENRPFGFQLAAQLAKVVDFTVEDNAVTSVGGEHRLVGACIQVENSEASMTQNYTITCPYAFRVRTAQAHSVRHAPERIDQRCFDSIVF
jgi:hypothetical protein